jgi:hypothetical protein
MIPVQKYLVGVGLKLFKKSLASTDKRIGLISEVMGSMEIIKCYAWEPSLSARILETRATELKWIQQNSIIRAINMFFISAIPIFVTVFTFLVYVALGNQLTASVAFTSLSLFSVLRMPLIMLPQVINQAIQTSVALGRLQKMLTSDALSDDGGIAKASKGENAIVVEKSDYKWSNDTATVLHKFELQVPAGQLLAVIGTVLFFRQKFTLEDAIEFHAFAPLEASRRVTNGIPLGCSLFLPVHTVNCVQTQKVRLAAESRQCWQWLWVKPCLPFRPRYGALGGMGLF